jgi:hypothetical protein
MDHASLTTLSQILLTLHAQNAELATLTARMGYLQIGTAAFMAACCAYIAYQGHRLSAESWAIAQQTAELLRRTPPQEV